ncbi:MAG: response regulator [Roseiflexaceae bacterium]|nr:response regulator [Roseiflexaceae bacterium]
MLNTEPLIAILVHADAAIRATIELLLRERAVWQIHAVSNGGDAVRVALAVLPQVVLLNPYLRGMDGVATIAALRAHRITCPVVALVERDDESQSLWQERGFAGSITLSADLSHFAPQLQLLLTPHERTR